MWAGRVVCEVRWRNEARPGGRRSQATWRIGRQSGAGAGSEEWLWKAMALGVGSWVWKETRVWRRWSCCIREVEECRGCFQMLHTTGGQDRTGRDGREEAATVQRERTQDREKGGRRQKRERGQMKQENQQRPTSPSYVLISMNREHTGISTIG